MRLLLTIGRIVGAHGQPETLLAFIFAAAPANGFRVIQNHGFWELWPEATGHVLILHEADTPGEECITCRVVKNLHANRDKLLKTLA